MPFWRSFAKDSNILRGWLILLIFCHYVDVLRGFLNSLNLCLILLIFCYSVEVLKGCSNILSWWLIHFYPGLDGHTAASTLPGWLPGKTGAEVMVGRANSICPHRPPLLLLLAMPIAHPHPHSEALHWWYFLQDKQDILSRQGTQLHQTWSDSAVKRWSRQTRRLLACVEHFAKDPHPPPPHPPPHHHHHHHHDHCEAQSTLQISPGAPVKGVSWVTEWLLCQSLVAPPSITRGHL